MVRMMCRHDVCRTCLVGLMTTGMVHCPLCRRPLQVLGGESTLPEPPLPEAPAARPPVIRDPWEHFSNPWAIPIRVRALAPRGSRRDLRGARDLWDPHASGSSAASDSRAPHSSAPSADSTTPQSGYVVLRNGSRESQLGIHWCSWRVLEARLGWGSLRGRMTELGVQLRRIHSDDEGMQWWTSFCRPGSPPRHF